MAVSEAGEQVTIWGRRKKRKLGKPPQLAVINYCHFPGSFTAETFHKRGRGIKMEKSERLVLNQFWSARFQIKLIPPGPKITNYRLDGKINETLWQPRSQCFSSRACAENDRNTPSLRENRHLHPHLRPPQPAMERYFRKSNFTDKRCR